MHRAEIIACGLNEAALDRLQTQVRKGGVWLRPVQHDRPCFDLAARNSSAVVILHLGRDLEKELGLLRRLTWLLPDCRCVVTGEEANPDLAGLAWDLGAAYVLFPPQSWELLGEIALGLLPGSKTANPQ